MVEESTKARAIKLLTYEDGELASLLIEVRSSRYALSQGSRTGCKRLDDELFALLSRLSRFRKALVTWLWEADGGLNRMKDNIQQWDVA